jgi:hypothetical protein
VGAEAGGKAGRGLVGIDEHVDQQAPADDGLRRLDPYSHANDASDH